MRLFICFLVPLIALPGCERTKIATGLTAVEVVILHDPTSFAIDQVRIAGTAGGQEVVPPSVRPETPTAAPLGARETLLVLLPDGLDGQTLQLDLTGLWQFDAVARGVGEVAVVVGETVQVQVVLNAAVCGDGVVDGLEACDDGNTAPRDGCSSLCDLEAGWVCQNAPSQCAQTCGNGTIDPGEGCDDLNVDPGDGCDASCQVELGWECTGTPSVCTPVGGCGDGTVDASEACDDGNTTGGDGCSGNCQSVESGWVCTGAPSVCTPLLGCGDGSCDTAGGEGTSSCPVDCAWVAIDAGSSHACAIKADGTAWCWGDNGFGQLGTGNNVDSLTAVQVIGTPLLVAITCGGTHTCAIDEVGKVWCWGNNGVEGRLGVGSTGGSFSTPQQTGVSDLVVAIDAGGRHTCVVQGDQTVWCWGDGAEGRLGNGSTSPEPTPAQVVGLNNAVDVSCRGHSCAYDSAGRGWCWGGNVFGELGDGTTANSNLPVQVAALTAVVGIAAGTDSSCAVESSGNVWCWGSNQFGQLGNGITLSSLVPVSVALSGTASAVETGGDHACAIRSDATVWCWGENNRGQLGNGTMTNSAIPVQAIGISGASGLAMRGNSCAVTSAGHAYCWGANADGKLGDGTTTDRDLPTLVIDPYP